MKMTTVAGSLFCIGGRRNERHPTQSMGCLARTNRYLRTAIASISIFTSLADEQQRAGNGALCCLKNSS